MPEKPFALAVPHYEELSLQEPYLGDKVWERLCEYSSDFVFVPINGIRFSDTAGKIETMESVRKKDVYVVHPVYLNADSHTRVACQISDELHRSAAHKDGVFLFDLYNRHFRQDSRKKREPLTAREVADEYETHDVDRVFTVDPHSEKLGLAFSSRCPLEALHVSGELAQYFKENHELTDCVVCAPDIGAYDRATRFADLLKLPLIGIRKIRHGDGQVEALEIIGDIDKYVKNRRIIIRDDILGTGSTLVTAANKLLECGAREIYGCITHLDLTGDARKRIMNNGFRIIGTNTVPKYFTEEERKFFEVYDISDFLAQVISYDSQGGSLSEFFQDRMNSRG